LTEPVGAAAKMGSVDEFHSSETRLDDRQPDLCSVHDFDVNIDLKVSPGNHYFSLNVSDNEPRMLFLKTLLFILFKAILCSRSF